MLRQVAWDGPEWSPWHQLDRAIEAYNAVAPATPAIYRLKCEGVSGLIYVGETGGSLLHRLRQLRKATEYVAQGRPPGAPHVAGLCVHQHEESGKTVLVSWIDAPSDVRERQGLKCDVIASYRAETGENPTCQFGGRLG